MAPEILLKNCYDSTADLWSIGVILYECLFGKAPYSSKSIAELLIKIQKQEKIEFNKLIKVSDNCKDILMQLLIHNPKNRINFDNFFLHPFLNLNNEPTDVDVSLYGRCIMFIVTRCYKILALKIIIFILFYYVEFCEGNGISIKSCK